jgi:hypothetical protein
MHIAFPRAHDSNMRQLPLPWFFPFTPVGMAALTGIGTVIMMMLGRRDGIVTTGITTALSWSSRR